MPNPRYIINPDHNNWTGEPTQELVEKLKRARDYFFKRLCFFCNKYGFDINEIANTERVFLVGSHAEEKKWHNDTSDLDIKLVNSSARLSHLYLYKYKVLDPGLNAWKDKSQWIDIYFAHDEREVFTPRWDITNSWI
jgi:hypothetical protein